MGYGDKGIERKPLYRDSSADCGFYTLVLLLTFFFCDQVTISKEAEFEWSEGVSVALGTVCL